MSERIRLGVLGGGGVFYLVWEENVGFEEEIGFNYKNETQKSR